MLAAAQQAVVIEVQGDRGGPVDQVVAGCNAALGRERCRSVGDDSSESGAAFYALVVWPDSERLEVRVELRDPEGRIVTERDVLFSARDTIAQRYRAVGLIIAAQVLGATTGESQADQEDQADQGDDSAVEASTATRRSPTWGLDVGAGVARGLDWDVPRIGGVGRGWARPWAAPLIGFLSVRGAISGGEPELSWVGGGLGLGLARDIGGALLTLRVELLVERVTASATDGSTGDRVSRGLVRLGPLGSLDIGFPATSPVSAFLGLEAQGLYPEVTLYLRGREAGRLPAPGGAAVVGVRFQP